MNIIMEKYIKDMCAFIAAEGYLCEKTVDIPYGKQIYVSDGIKTHLIRVYQNKKGKITLDNSPVKSEALKKLLMDFNCSDEDRILLRPPLIGSDEAGKGDYIGPLTVAAVYADEKMYDSLITCGVKDSKKLTDDKIEKLQSDIIRICPFYSIIEIGNARFNEIYEKTPNINVLLTWAHAKAIKNVLGQIPCTNVLTDKFSFEGRLENALKDENINLVQKPKGEQNAAVAAASILARYTYMHKLKLMSEKYGVNFCAGAGENADNAAREFVKKHGGNKLAEICKISYKNTQKVIIK